MAFNTYTLLFGVILPLLLAILGLGKLGYDRRKRNIARELQRQRELAEQAERERLEQEARHRQEEFERRLQQEETRRKALFRDTLDLRLFDEEWRRTEGQGQVGGFFSGTFAARMLVQFASAFVRASAAEHLGPLLLLELSEDERDRCLSNLPEHIRAKVIPARCERCPEGLTGADLAEAIDRQEEWWFEVETAIRSWVAHMQHDARVACLVGYVSPGGSAILAYPALSIFREDYRHAPVYINTILDSKPQVRHRFPEVRQLLLHNGLATGTIVRDNTRDSKRHDIGNALFYASAVNAPWIDDQPSSLPNLGAHIFPRECHCGAGAHKYATQSVYGANIPVYYEPEWENVLPGVYYTKASMAVATIQRCIRTVLERPDLQSIPLEPVSQRHTRDLYISAPISPPHLQHIAERVRDNLKAYLDKHHPYVSLHFASIGVPLKPTDIQAPVVAVLIQALKDDGTALDALAEYRHTVADKFIIRELRDIDIPTRKAQLPPPEGATQ